MNNIENDDSGSTPAELHDSGGRIRFTPIGETARVCRIRFTPAGETARVCRIRFTPTGETARVCRIRFTPAGDTARVCRAMHVIAPTGASLTRKRWTDTSLHYFLRAEIAGNAYQVINSTMRLLTQSGTGSNATHSNITRRILPYCAFILLTIIAPTLVASTTSAAVAQVTEEETPPDVTLTPGMGASSAAGGAPAGPTMAAPGAASTAGSTAGGASSPLPGIVTAGQNAATAGGATSAIPGLVAGGQNGSAAAANSLSSLHLPPALQMMLAPGAKPVVPQPGASANTQGNLAVAQQLGADAQHDPTAVIQTNKGTIIIHLFRSRAPHTVDNFIDLAQKGFYNGLTFHRVEPGFCIQGGDPTGTGTGLYTDPISHQIRYIPLEISPALKHNAPGVVAMARSNNLNSASCQFYITLSPQPNLDGKYAVFGGVIGGMNVVNQIAKGDRMLSVTIK